MSTDSLSGGVLTVQEAVVLEAASTEERVEGVHGLVARHGLGERPVHVGRALGRRTQRVARHGQRLVPAPTRHRLYSVRASCTLYASAVRLSSTYQWTFWRER